MNSKNIEHLIAWNGCRIIWKIRDTMDQNLVDELGYKIDYPRSANLHVTNSVRSVARAKMRKYNLK